VKSVAALIAAVLFFLVAVVYALAWSSPTRSW
jgi:hypothetical protein